MTIYQSFLIYLLIYFALMKTVMMNYPVGWCKPLRRLEYQENAENVALVSYPCSSNYWLRFLLQQATGIYTGSESFRYESRAAGLLEKVTKRVLVVKRHTALVEPTNYTRAILLVRDPKDVIPSRFKSFHGRHAALIQASNFKGPDFDRFLKVHLQAWIQFYMKSLSWTKGPIYIVYHEILLQDTKATLEGVLKFLKRNYTESDIDCAVDKFTALRLLPLKTNNTTSVFSPKQLLYIASQIPNVMQLLQMHHNKLV